MSDNKRHARVYSHTIVLPISSRLTPALTPANADPTGRAQRSSCALARQRLNQTVVSVPTLTVRDGHEITGFCFTPQDGNALLSSIAATAWLMYPDTCEQRIHQFVYSYLFDEVEV